MTCWMLLSCFSAAAGIGLLVFVLMREPKSMVRRTLLWFLAACVAERLLEASTTLSMQQNGLVLIHRLRLLAIALQLGPLYRFSKGYARGDARDRRSERWIVICAYLLPPVCVLLGWPWSAAAAAQTGSTAAYPGWSMQLGLSGMILHVLAMLTTVLVLLTLEQTLRASIGTMRWRVKYTVLGLVVYGIARMYMSSQEVLHGAVIHPSLFTVGAAAFLVTSGLLGLALRRGPLQAIDIYPSQEVLRHSVTMMLAGVYLLIVGLLAYLTRWIGGTDALAFRSLLALAAVLGVAVILLSDRVRLWAKQFVALHFRRPRYDYRLTWETLVQHTSSQMDIASFAQAAAQVISQTFESLSVSLWVVDPSRRRFTLAGSTLLDRSRGNQVASVVSDEEAILDGLASLTRPVDLHQTAAPWAAALLKAHPDSFQTGQTVCAPLRVRDTTVAAALVGDRVGYRPFLTEDYVLLKTMSDHLAARLQTIQLSRELVAAKEFEAFQVMSTFFVHDLKNLASTLTLLLRNFRRHFDKPAFRDDALQTISDTVDRLNQTIEQLTLLRGRPALRRRPTTLPDVARKVLAELQDAIPQCVTTRWEAAPLVTVDVEQLSKVLTNLLLNARDACGPDGQIEMVAGAAPPWATLSVRDDGEGMSAEFIEQSLFRPFHSTKKKGLGIGLFHSKHLVEAHGGRIEVDSEPKHGTTFRVLVPLTEDKGGNGEDTGHR